MPLIVSAFASGLLFGLGLIVSQMVNPAKVLGFLDIFGDWDRASLSSWGARSRCRPSAPSSPGVAAFLFWRRAWRSRPAATSIRA